MNRTLTIITAAVLVLVVGGGTWYYLSQNRENQAAPSARPSADGSTQNPSDKKSKAPDTDNQSEPVSVYYSKSPESDADPSAVFPVKRISPDDNVAGFALKELVKGPTEEEAKKGYFTPVKLRGDALQDDFTLSISDGTATVKFLRQFDHTGIVVDGQAESALKATLKQFSTVQKVVILDSSGNCEFDASGQNRCME